MTTAPLAAIDADTFRRQCYEIVGEVNGYRDDHVLAALCDAVNATQQRDEWVARAITAEDALKQRDGIIDRLHTELDQARNAHHRQGDQIARQRGEIAELGTQLADACARAAGRCGLCGRTAATHFLIRGHRFAPAGRADG